MYKHFIYIFFVYVYILSKMALLMPSVSKILTPILSSVPVTPVPTTPAPTTTVTKILQNIGSLMPGLGVTSTTVASVVAANTLTYSGDALNTIKASTTCGACGPANNVQGSCSDLGAEWQWDSAGSCGGCSFNCVNFGALGNACTSGANPNCKKFQYTGTSAQCCLGQMPTGYPSTTCDPSFTPLASKCSATVQSYCSQGNNIFTNTMCQNWASQNPTLAQTMKQTYCTPSKLGTDSNCRAWVGSDATQGQIDSTMATYCKTNPNDNMCSCMNSEIPCPNKFDTNCIKNSGYETADMMNVTCPSVMNCTQFVSLSPGAQAIATNVQQNCSTTTNTGSSTPTITPAPAASTTWTSDQILMFAIFLLILIVVSIYVSGRKKHHKHSELTETVVDVKV